MERSSSEDSENSQSPKQLSTNEHIHFILWPTAEEFFEPIIQHLDRELGVESTQKINLGENLPGFVKDVYEFDGGSRLMEYKSHKINEDGDCIIHVKCQPSSDYPHRLENDISDIKDMIRSQYFPYVPDDSYHNIMHGPESAGENKWVEQVIKEYI